MIAKISLIITLLYVTRAEDCLKCICNRESGCAPVGCNMDMGSLACGFYQMCLPYYEDCGTPGRGEGEDVTAAWQRCANDYDCATQCVQAYYERYKNKCDGTGQGPCEVMSRLHNGGPGGCHTSATDGYWNAIQSCCGCS
ncbi:unnamed protein product [Cylicocyclus nassatus]|uniref:lysozyme n=1 Tax=Cylicocyclus nassatus TaxID=53992 RepID=A0AA36H193_CYLNA|nr:unnamed protein product [Cylicocyclus nassatus]